MHGGGLRGAHVEGPMQEMPEVSQLAGESPPGALAPDRWRNGAVAEFTAGI